MKVAQLKFKDLEYLKKVTSIKEKLEDLGYVSVEKCIKENTKRRQKYKAYILLIKIFLSDNFGECYGFGLTEEEAIISLYKKLISCENIYRYYIDGKVKYRYCKERDKFVRIQVC